MIQHYSDRVLAVDIQIARHAGALAEKARAMGQDPGLADLLIGSTAAVHGLDLMTDHMRHFTPLPLGFDVLNPFERLPPRG